MIRRLIMSLLALGAVWQSTAVMAHPHIWGDSYYRVVVNQPTVQTLEANWEFDLFSSLDMLMAFDTNADGVFQGQEKAEAAVAMTNLAQYGYFLRIQVDGEDVVPAQVSIVDLAISDQKLQVKLGIELAEPVNIQQQTLRIGFGDKENYFAMVIPDAGLIQLTGVLAETCTPIPVDAEEFYMEGWIDLHCDRG